jgi:hypothetical protein
MPRRSMREAVQAPAARIVRLAGYGVGFVVDQELLHACFHELDSSKFLDFFAKPYHGAFSICPA